MTEPGSLYPLTYNQVSILLSFCIPLSFGFAMLRSHLWDVDVLINRALVYGTLTVIVTGVYVGLVMGLSALLRGLISQDNSVAIVLSTLASVVLSQPLRRRIQRLIDRRFYRHKYDAARTLADFSAALRKASGLEAIERTTGSSGAGDHATRLDLVVAVPIRARETSRCPFSWDTKKHRSRGKREPRRPQERNKHS